MANYQQLSFECTPQQATVLENLLLENGALSVSFLEDPDEMEPIFEPALNTTPLWSKLTLVALFSEDYDLNLILPLITLTMGDQFHYEIEIIEDRDWVSETQANFQPQCYQNKLWVYPDWYEIPAEHKPVIKISPGLAFGTGNHATTQMCLSQLCLSIKPGDVVIDFGCGSGILALAAIALGAAKVYAVDIDPQALEATRDNAKLNNIDSEQIIAYLPQQLSQDVKADVVVANILAQPLIELRDTFLAHLKPQGKLIMSGLLMTQEQEVIQRYQEKLAIQVLEQFEEWSCIGA